jgi:hypothetical protein
MGISRRSTFLHVCFSCSGVSAGGVSESNESRTLSWRILGDVNDFSILAAVDGYRGRGGGEGQVIETSLRASSLRAHVPRWGRFSFHPEELQG